MTGRPTVDSNRGQGFLGGLDGLRAVAVLLVYAFHTFGEIFPQGSLGVDVFFVISGYLITGLLIAEHEHIGGIHLRYFFRNRLLRLYPALAVYLFLTPVAARMIGQSSQTILTGTWRGAFYVQDFARAGLFGDYGPPGPDLYGHLWSLAVEEQFYLVWPFVLIVMMRVPVPTRLRFLSIMVATAVSIRLVSSLTIGEGPTYFLPTGHLDAILIGALTAQLLASPHRERVRMLVSREEVAWTCAVAVLVSTIAIQPSVAHIEDWGLGATLDTCVAVVIAHIALHTRRSRLNTALSVRPLRWLGRRSYAFYLWHLAVLAMIAESLPDLPRRLVSVLGMAGSVAVVALSWRFIERPALKLKRHATDPR